MESDERVSRVIQSIFNRRRASATLANDRRGIAPKLNGRGYNLLSISSRILTRRSLRRAINRPAAPARKRRFLARREREGGEG